MPIEASMIWIYPKLPLKTAGQGVVAEEVEKRGHNKRVIPDEKGVM